MGLGTEQQTTERGIAALVGRLADGLGRLVSQHIQLARAELGEDLRAMGLDVARIAVFVPFVLVGYLFVCGALAALLARWLGWAGALALVGGVNLVGGGFGIFRAVQRLRTRDLMDDTAQELSRSVSVARTTLQGGAPSNGVKVPMDSDAVPAAGVLPQAAPVKNVLKEQPNGR